MRKTNKIKEPVHTAYIPQPEMLSYYHWAKEFKKETIETANDYLGKMLTFSIALFSVVIAFNDKINVKFQPYIVASLLISTLIAFIGNFPIEKQYNPNKPNTIESAIREIIISKRYYVIGSFIAVFVSMCLFFISIISKSSN